MERRNKKKSGGTGFYIALCCCVTILGIVGYINNRTSAPDSGYETEIMDADTPDRDSGDIIDVTPAPVQEEDTSAPTLAPLLPDTAAEQSDTEPVYSEPEEEPDTSASTAVSAGIDAEPEVVESGENGEFYDGPTVESVSILEQPSFSAPISGNIIESFECEKLIYNSALGDWRTHNGVDIKGDAGTPVCASCDGEIMDIYESAYGKTVILTHENNFKTVYSNLEDTDKLEIGQKISKGEKIAPLGSYTTGERAAENHLHFEMIKGESPVNPEDYINF